MILQQILIEYYVYNTCIIQYKILWRGPAEAGVLGGAAASGGLMMEEILKMGGGGRCF